MKLKKISTFEVRNPHLAINVVSYKNQVVLKIEEDILKNPNVDIFYRSKNGDDLCE